MKHFLYISLGLCCLGAVAMFFSSCHKPTAPKEYGYYRITLPAHSYSQLSDRPSLSSSSLPYSFLMSDAAEVRSVEQESDWINIVYPSLNATIHCSYKSVHGNLRMLLDDAQEFVYSHSVKASAIPEQEYSDAAHHVYGVFYELEGNTASPAQFFVTDSTHHFFRAAVYINTIPNQDSLAPVIDFLKADLRTMVESFRWQ